MGISREGTLPRLCFCKNAGSGALLLVLAGCAGTPPRGYGPWEGERSGVLMPAPELTVSGLLGPVSGTSMDELRRLDLQPNTATTTLRRAFVLVESGQQTVARSELNRLLFGDVPPSPSIEAYALYIRARSFAATGDAARARDDLDRAGSLAIASDLRERIASERPATVATRPPVAAPPSTGSRSFLARSAWHAQVPLADRMVPMSQIHRLTVHHSSMLAGRDSMESAAATLRSIQKTHIVGNGWGDIGYHYLIDRAGRVWIGRPIQWQGAHAGDAERNRGNVGICLLGNFVRGRDGQSPTGAQLASLRAMMADLCRTHRIPVTHIYTHREMNVTVCPGENLQAAVDDMRRELSGVAGVPQAATIRGE